MTKINLTTKLNIKIACIVLVLMVMVTAFSQWLYLQEENSKNFKLLASITEFLVEKNQISSFTDIAIRQGVDNRPLQEQVLSINKEVQPRLDTILVSQPLIKFGYYSKAHKSIVAIGPQPDISMLAGIDSNYLRKLYETNTVIMVKKENSLVWHGATVIMHIRPIEQQGMVIGHAFACVNQDAVYAMVWKRTLYMLFGAFLMLLVCVAIFRELFVQLKIELTSFAESICSGRARNHACEFAELTPLLDHISEQTAKMTHLDRLNIIGEMAAGIAHEVRNPMTTVRGLLQFLGMKDEFIKHKDKFDLMITEIDRANTIITEFLSLAKDRAMEFKKVNINDVIDEIYPLLQADATRNNCEIVLLLDDIPAVLADKNSIRQLLLNMVRNGLDAMPHGGVIEICTAAEEARILLAITDHGVGIQPEDKEKLGTPFFTTKENGSGLGLAVCYRIAQRHGASIVFDSEAGKGTTFTIAFAKS